MQQRDVENNWARCKLYARHMAGQFQLQQLQPLHHCQHCFSNMVFWDVKRKRNWEREREMISGDRDVKRLFFNTQVVLLITKPIGTVLFCSSSIWHLVHPDLPRSYFTCLHLHFFKWLCWHIAGNFVCARSFNGLSSVIVQMDSPSCWHRFVRFREKWQKLGTLRHSSWGKPCRTVWLAEKPVRRGGAWGIGCTFCAFLVDELAKHPEERKRLNLDLFQ